MIATQDNSPGDDPRPSRAVQLYAPLQWEVLMSSLLLATGIAAGAFGAHALRDSLSSYQMGVYEKAVFYQIISGLGVGMVAALGGAGVVTTKRCRTVASLLFCGSLIFSGSLYVLVLTDRRWLGAITPIGGTLMMAAWIALFFGAIRPSHTVPPNQP